MLFRLAKDSGIEPAAPPVVSPPPTRFKRWVVRLLVAVLVSIAITTLSNMTSFGDRMTAMTLPQTLELDFKLKLAESKYGSPVKRTIDLYATDSDFKHLLLEHGEQVIPIIAFFVENDLPSIRARYELKKLPEKIRHWWPWRNRNVTATVEDDYSPKYRGLYAIDRAIRDGHDFLGQFDIKDGKAKWNNTERAGEAVSEFLAGGIRNVERKRNLGASITPMDWANAGSDVLVLFSAAKLLKLPKAMPTAAQSAERIKGMGQALGSNALARNLLLHSVRAGTAYLIATHPSLLTGLFVDVATALNIPAWWGVVVGWFVVVLLLSFLLLPLLAAASFLIPVVRLISQAAHWLQPVPRIFGWGAAPSKPRIS